MKRLPAYLLLLLSLPVAAQKIGMADRRLLQKKEDSLKVYADSMINAEHAGKRFLSDSQFVKTFVRALKIPNSFSYPFDSLLTVSRLYPADSSFRIFTWQLKKDEYMYYQKGAIQMRTPDGSLKLYPLFDASMFTAKPDDSIRTRKNWIGAIYYRIIQKEFQGRKYYTLLGFDDYTIGSNRKWMEVLHFDEQTGEPLFGGPYFSFKDDTAKVKPVLNRFNIEYKKEARTLFNYNPEMDMIVYDHLTSETEEPKRKETYIPDGDFEGFRWENGQWVHVDQVFNFKLKDGEFPQDATIKDASGNVDEKKLMEQSEKNIENAKKREEQQKKPVKKKD
ncbi:MAG: hypothetical protein KGO82_03470 [Bacteroidota bacterium]|nr:hypothetical protein [Bacteroidota bacterium]